MTLSTKVLAPALWPDFEAFFQSPPCGGCWCMNHRLPMGLNFEGEAARLAMRELVTSSRVFGLLAYAEGDPIPVGWCALDRRETLPGHDCIGTDIACGPQTWSLHCVVARADWKGRGVEDRLQADVLRLAKELGATRVEAYPEPDSQRGRPFTSWNSFSGCQQSLEALGFVPFVVELGASGEFYRPLAIEITP